MRVTGNTIVFRTIFEQLMRPRNPTHTEPKVQQNTNPTDNSFQFSPYGLPPLKPSPVGVQMNEIRRE